MALPYTTAVIKETMRIYPPMPVTIRRSLRDGTLGRYRVRKGDIILVGTLAAQRDPRYWGPEPDRFDPEQFDAATATKATRRRCGREIIETGSPRPSVLMAGAHVEVNPRQTRPPRDRFPTTDSP